MLKCSLMQSVHLIFGLYLLNIRLTVVAFIPAYSFNRKSFTPTSQEIVLSRCDKDDPSQNWVLSSGGWGSNNTIQNLDIFTANTEKQVACLDVLDWKVNETGASVTAHVCCHQTTSKEPCKFPQRNYNEQWVFQKLQSSTKTHDSGMEGNIRVMSDKRIPGLCLDAKLGAVPGSPVSIAMCSTHRSLEQIWTVTSDGTAPLISIPAAAPSPAAGQKLCLSSDVNPPAPSPGPVPSSYRGCSLANTTNLPFCNTSLSMSERAHDLVVSLCIKSDFRSSLILNVLNRHMSF